MESVSVASSGKFKCDIKSADAKFGGQADPAQFLCWCLSTLTQRKIFEKHFQGQLQVTSLTKKSGDED